MFAVEDTKTEKNQQKIGSIGALVHIYKHCFFSGYSSKKSKVLLTQLFLFFATVECWVWEKFTHVLVVFNRVNIDSGVWNWKYEFETKGKKFQKNFLGVKMNKMKNNRKIVEN